MNIQMAISHSITLYSTELEAHWVLKMIYFSQLALDLTLGYVILKDEGMFNPLTQNEIWDPGIYNT